MRSPAVICSAFTAEVPVEPTIGVVRARLRATHGCLRLRDEDMKTLHLLILNASNNTRQQITEAVTVKVTVKEGEAFEKAMRATLTMCRSGASSTSKMRRQVATCRSSPTRHSLQLVRGPRSQGNQEIRELGHEAHEDHEGGLLQGDQEITCDTFRATNSPNSIRLAVVRCHPSARLRPRS